MFKFLHAADLHLDSPLRGLDRYEGAPVDAIRQATRKAVGNLVDLAIAEKVAFVLIAGDIYDGDQDDYNTAIFFVRAMEKLRSQGIAVYLIRGNHDAASVITRGLTLPSNVFELPTGAPATLIHEPTNVAVHGQGFAKKAVEVDLTEKYPKPEPGCFNIGMLHTCASGSPEHMRYAPCTLDGLCNFGYDYWALGHIHLRQSLRDSAPHVAFPGNTQGRHMRETGPKGCLLVTVEGGQPRPEFRPLDVFRWERCETDATGCRAPDDVLDAIARDLRSAADRADGLPVAVRVEVSGGCDAHARLTSNVERWESEVRVLAAREVGEAVWIEKVRFATSPVEDSGDLLSEGPLSELRRLACDAERDAALLSELAEELAELSRKLPPAVREFIAPGGFDDPAWLRPRVADAGRLLLGRLADGVD